MAAPDPTTVAVYRGEPSYCSETPYHPDTAFPEFGTHDVFVGPPNPAFRALRQALRLMGCDAERFDTPDWNPFGEWVRPDDRVLIKPNWVLHAHPSEARSKDPVYFESLITHPSVLRAVIDYVQLALRGRGSITLADAPLQHCDFETLQRRCGMAPLAEYYRELAQFPAAGAPFRPVPITVRDLRLETAVQTFGVGGIAAVYEKHRKAGMDDHTIVDLAERSALEAISHGADRFRVTCYDPKGMANTHRAGLHRYCVGNEILEADVVVNVPKLKTHRKSGLTVALKNLIGINGHKSYLPHHRQGSVASGGDEFLTADALKTAASALQDRQFDVATGPTEQRGAAIASSLLAVAGRLVREDGTETGSWYGNDTIWRTCLDLNRILLYARANGTLPAPGAPATPARRVVHVVDGLIGGDLDGPLDPRPRPSGVVLVGTSAAFVDLTAALVMGLNWQNIPLVREAFGALNGLPLAVQRPTALELVSNVPEWDHPSPGEIERGLATSLGYAPATGWEAVALGTSDLPVEASVRRPGVLWTALRRWSTPLRMG